MNKLAMHISLLRKKIGLTESQLAELVGVGETTINNLETGYLQSPPDWMIETIAGIFNTTTAGLCGGESLTIGDASAVYVADSISNDMALLEIDKIIDTIFIDKSELHGFQHIGLRIKDNSMANARICCGDTVLVRQGVPLKNGDIAVVICKDKDAIVRRIYRNDNKVLLKAESDDRLYPDITVDTDKERFVEVGKVVKCLFDL